jgi:hypothetical protein
MIKCFRRGGRPILICEEGDEETKQLSPDGTYIEIPHTVDCLQVGTKCMDQNFRKKRRNKIIP